MESLQRKFAKLFHFQHYTTPEFKNSPQIHANNLKLFFAIDILFVNETMSFVRIWLVET